MATIEAEIAAEPEVEGEPDFPTHLMTIERYERLVESGVYGPKDPVFLWKGKLVEKMSKGRPHCVTSMILFRILDRMMPEGWHVEHESPLKIGMDSMPEPDLMVVRGDPRDYLKRSPTARDVAIVVEVADSSVPQDTVSKLRAYAGDAIPVYWIVNIPKHRVEVYGLPTGPAEKSGFGEHRHFGPDEEIPVVLEGREVGRIAVRELLP